MVENIIWPCLAMQLSGLFLINVLLSPPQAGLSLLTGPGAEVAEWPLNRL